MTSHETARAAAAFALEKKAHDVAILELGSLSDVTDYFVVCTGDTDTHVKAIADHVDDQLRIAGSPVWRREGLQTLQWVLLDCVDVVVHVFQPRVREYYDIERLWGDAPIEKITDAPDGTVVTVEQER
ncbi:MAG: ribosome silencing factor [Ignavibacteriae bacterium]|nr:ribosome silencing factor [Ignavibacteriota bacterium]